MARITGPFVSIHPRRDPEEPSPKRNHQPTVICCDNGEIQVRFDAELGMDMATYQKLAGRSFKGSWRLVCDDPEPEAE